MMGRDEEIYCIVQVLQRRTKNSPMLIGKLGVDKTIIIEDLASHIIDGVVLDGFKIVEYYD